MARRSRRHSFKSRRRNPSGKEAGKAALTILAAGAGAAFVNKVINDQTVPAAGATAPRMTLRNAKLLQVGIGAAAGIALAAYGKPMVGAAVGAALVAPAAEPLYTALRAPAAGLPANNPYMMGAGAYR